MKIVLLSDTHTYHNEITVPNGDVLIHAGDFSLPGKREELIEFNSWIGSLPHKHKIVVAGNHDSFLENFPKEAQSLITNFTYLQDSEITVEGLRIYGTPWVPEFCGWSFMKEEVDLKTVYQKIPDNLDILVTHGPPKGILDLVDGKGPSVGSTALKERLTQLHQKKTSPRFHVFGHIHGGYGRSRIGNTTFINAANCTEKYEPINPVITLKI